METGVTTVTDGEGKKIQYHYNSNKNVDEIVENPLDEANKAVTTFGYGLIMEKAFILSYSI